MIPNPLNPRGYIAYLALAALLVLPLATQSPFVIHLAIQVCVFAALASAWNIVGGFAGQLSLGHAVYYGIGSYAAGLLVLHFGISPWVGMIAGVGVSALVALVIAYPTLRLRGPFFSLASIAFLEVARLLVNHEEAWTHGAGGLNVPLQIGLKWMIFREKWAYLLVAFCFLMVVLGICHAIRHSRFGYYLIAVREREDAARAIGINPVRVKIAAAVISACLTSLIGSFHGMYLTFIEPSSAFSLELSIQVAMFALIGGLGTVAGPVLGAVVVLPIAELARGWLSAFGNGTHGFVYGVVLVAVVLFFPRGLVGQLGGHVTRLIDKLPDFGRARRVAVAPLPATLRDVSSVGQPILKADNIEKRFGGLKATDKVTLTLHEGEILGVIGPNGAGKTTVFNQLSGFLRPDGGTVTIRDAAGNWTAPRSPEGFARAGVGRTFQIVQPFAGLTVLENLLLGAFMRTKGRDQAEALARSVAEVTELTPLLDTEARSLTVGGMKRLEIARALATSPRVLLLDEVLAGLNPSDVARAIVMIRRIRESGVSVLMIEHLMQATMALSDRIVVIHLGKVLKEGLPADVANDVDVIQAYLGKGYTHASGS
ncbi:branched-chain amino acid ABC transporter ATP-binding protein/permease [Variovorax sp. PAMC28562]|uniref:branched-chain amino acid ABC transporter ATP-binding protein/permease n=1 Tax=Variovorax sp. PAMC28562 TaxID=2762323 RepID=UPI00164E88FC|nr:branched-chain amino acid ABC transporter ATP-binding protein/permease [Variovorax sp. PAMC28562]QNK74489.1 branched-chain amino acid ABC transporter ATP-binding protein/permease [Variovorax sp. PAMC28562]